MNASTRPRRREMGDQGGAAWPSLVQRRAATTCAVCFALFVAGCGANDESMPAAGTPLRVEGGDVVKNRLKDSSVAAAEESWQKRRALPPNRPNR